MKWTVAATRALVAMPHHAVPVRGSLPAPNVVAGHLTPLAAPSFEVERRSGDSVFVKHRGDTRLRLTAQDAAWVLPRGAPPSE
jgi:hypothetical protein